VTTDASSALLRRLERGALVWCALAATGVLIVAPARTDVLLGVLGGGLISIVSFYAIRGSVDAFLRPPSPDPSPAPGPDPGPEPGPEPGQPARAPRRPGGSAALKLVGRYALLALLAYVMIARLRLHPLGLLLGMTALAASATAEAVRGLGRPGRAS
jgi:hypothetical protein